MDSPAVEKTNRSPLNAQLLSFAGRSERALRKLSIFWRLALSSLAIIIVVAGVNLRPEPAPAAHHLEHATGLLSLSIPRHGQAAPCQALRPTAERKEVPSRP